MHFAKRLAVAVLALVLLVKAAPAHAEWVPGTATNPGNGAVLVESVATMADDQYVHFCTTAFATVTATFRVQHRNAANDTTIKEQYFPSGFSFCSEGEFLMHQNERVRIITFGAIVGTASVSLGSTIQ